MLQDLDEGKHTLRVRAVDPEGVADITPAYFEWIVDYTPPEAEILYTPVDYGNEFTGGIVFHFSEPVTGVYWQLDDREWQEKRLGKDDYWVLEYHGLTTGEHTARVKAYDLAGNTQVEEVVYRWHLHSLTITNPVEKLSIHGMTACAIEEPGKLWCWGYSHFGGVGVGETQFDLTIPEMPVTDSTWVDVSAHLTQTCGIKDDGSLWCWGIVPEGGVLNDFLTPYLVKFFPEKKWKKVSTGLIVSCGITDDSTLVCWQVVDSDVLGDDLISPLLAEKVDFGSGWRDVSAGWFHICGIKDDNSLWCRGVNKYGELGVGESYGNFVSEPVEVGGEWLKVSTGYGFTCGVKIDGTLWCWGDASDGKLGIGEDSGKFYYPQRITMPEEWIDISAGAGHACGIASDGRMYCWGRNRFGEIDGTEKEVLKPELVWDDLRWSSVSVGGAPSDGTGCPSMDTICGVTTTGRFLCRGVNNYGQFGNGTARFVWCPVEFDTR